MAIFVREQDITPMKLRTISTKFNSMLGNFLARISYRQKVALTLSLGVIVGLTGLFFYLLRMHTYIIGDDPAACINCHIMSPYYATWAHSAHARNTTCNDCHVPNNNIVSHYAFKQLNQEFVNTGRIDYMEAQRGEGKACWDCHRDVAHMNKNSLSSTPGAEYVEPMPPSPVPDWLQKALGKKQ